MDHQALTDYLGRQRWFAGKGRDWEITRTTDVGWLQTEPPTVRIVLIDVTYAGAETETYQLPVVSHSQPAEHLEHVFIYEDVDDHVWLYDALHDKEVTGLWAHGVADSRRLDGLTFHRSEPSPDVPLGAPSIVIGAEQSNTSLIFGDVAILKVFRKVAHGLNPDIEIHDALAGVAGNHIAEPLGWLEGRWTDGVTGAPGTGSLAMMQVYLRNASDGWELAKASVRDLFAEGDLHADEVGGDFAGEAARLGAATAEVHSALARTLRTDKHGREELRRLAEQMSLRLRRAAGEIVELGPYAEALQRRYDDLVELDIAVPVQRIHGDYHLGQVMRTLDGWKLLDFEGEPAKTLAERQALDSPLRDVAGMLRSFDYVARHLLADRPAEPHLEYRAAEWADRNRDAFCAGYAGVTGKDPREDGVILRAYETDKAVYEAVYEARNRPSWLRIPLSAIERLAATP